MEQRRHCVCSLCGWRFPSLDGSKMGFDNSDYRHRRQRPCLRELGWSVDGASCILSRVTASTGPERWQWEDELLCIYISLPAPWATVMSLVYGPAACFCQLHNPPWVFERMRSLLLSMLRGEHLGSCGLLFGHACPGTIDTAEAQRACTHVPG